MATLKGRRTPRNRSKETDLFVVMTNHLSCRDEIIIDLNNRIEKSVPLNFEAVTFIQHNDFNTEDSLQIVLIRLPSYKKASTVRDLLNKSNKRRENKVKCYFTEAEARGTNAVNVKELDKQQERKLQQAIVELLEVTQGIMNKHDDKIRDMQIVLRETDSKLKSRHGLSFDEFETIKDEQLAREDKLMELERQRNEYIGFIQSMQGKLKQLQQSDKFDNELRNIRIAFGIECHRLEIALPMYARRSDIVSTVRDNQVSVVLGETGSGKSTQMVQYLYQAGFAAAGLIACTQPRKIAAISLATHVSSELASRVGQIVGYQVGMQSKKTAVTKVLFMTDHILLNECLRDGDLSTYSCIIIDEAHERSIYTDLLLGMLKKCLAKRPELRVIITSATIDPDVFVSYFGGHEKCPVLRVSGRTFPVDVYWDADTTNSDSDAPFPEDFENKAVKKTLEIHSNKPISDGDILVFLTTPLETERCCDRVSKTLKGNDYQCHQLHGKLKPEEQQLVFAPNSKGKRKIVFATNSAETSITIPGIKFVIDTGVVKEMRYDPKKNMNSLDVVPVSQSSANQRKGRAGRTASGTCFRLYSENDFMGMDKSGTPEILRIHLGQGILKLMELGVNPLSFDFVQAPSSVAMDSAMETLVDIGAVEGTFITDMGKWIAKLPVEPRLGALIKKGIDVSVPTEAIMIAAGYTQSGIFFRTGSIEEKKKADMKKVRFCHKEGDLLTALSVFREWDKVDEKGKGKWCQENCINGKAMKGIRNTMNETSNALKKEANLKLKHQFRNPEEADAIIRNIIFQCLKSNLCFYLGHEKAGYVTLERLQHVQLHPSSSLHFLGQNPKWVVYGQLLKTSANFITNVTPVPEELVDNAKQEKISIDKVALEERKVVQVLKLPLSKQMYWKCVGPMHKTRREIEENIQSTCNNTVVILEADKPRSELTLYCVPMYKAVAVEMLEETVRQLSDHLLYESREEPIGNMSSGVRALLREGCSVNVILLPDQFRSVNIKRKTGRHEPTEEGILQVLSNFGRIEKVQKYRGRKQFWGIATFVNEHEAATTIQKINDDAECDFEITPIIYSLQSAMVDDTLATKGSSLPQYTMKLKWCRRLSKGICYVTLTNPDDTPNRFTSTAIRINGNPVSVSLANKRKGDSDLFIKGLDGNVTEEDIKEALFGVLELSPGVDSGRFKIVVPRHTVLFHHDEMNHTREKVTRSLTQHLQHSLFDVVVKEYKPQTVLCIAYVTFNDMENFSKAAKQLPSVRIDGSPINVNEFKTSVFLPKRVYNVIKIDFDAYLQMREKKKSTTVVQKRELKFGNVSISVSASSPERLAKIKLALNTIMDGDTRDATSVLLTREGKQKMHEIEKLTGVLIFVNGRNMKVIVQGSSKNRKEAVTLIDAYLDLVATSHQREISLKGENNPPGLMKAMLIKHGVGLESLRKETGLIFISLNLRNHDIIATGCDDAIQKTVDAIESIRKEVTGRVVAEDDETAECPICLCPIEQSDSCQLEYCGHAYCNVCLTSLFQSGVRDKQFPIVCAADACDKSIVIRDVNTQIKQGNVNMKELTKAAVDCFVARNITEYKYCITPDCEMIYHVTPDGKPFTCNVCHITICTTCRVPYHGGFTCDVYKGAEAAGVTCSFYKSALDAGMTCDMYKRNIESDNGIEKWVLENPANRKLCPKCNVGIEKNGGCNHMSCTCGAHICWFCLKYFSTSRECYDHMQSEHQLVN